MKQVAASGEYQYRSWSRRPSPFDSRRNSPYDSKKNSPYQSRRNSPHQSQKTSPFVSRKSSPQDSKCGTAPGTTTLIYPMCSLCRVCLQTICLDSCLSYFLLPSLHPCPSFFPSLPFPSFFSHLNLNPSILQRSEHSHECISYHASECLSSMSTASSKTHTTLPFLRHPWAQSCSLPSQLCAELTPRIAHRRISQL